jgi:hypothetical protein
MSAGWLHGGSELGAQIATIALSCIAVVISFAADQIRSRNEVEAITRRVDDAQEKLDRSYEDDFANAVLHSTKAAVSEQDGVRASLLVDLQQFHVDSDATKPRLAELTADSRVQPAWNVARGTLEKYWARNLNQNASIFWMSILASTVGFSVTLWGVSNAIQTHAATSGSILAAASGAVTQVIGTTFLVIYRSTAQQGLEFNRTRATKDAAKAALATSVAVAGGNTVPVTVLQNGDHVDESREVSTEGARNDRAQESPKG